MISAEAVRNGVDVGLERAGVLVEVLVRPELRRVDEDGRGDVAVGPGQPPALAQQRRVAGVQGAHGGHHANLTAILFPAAHARAQFGNRSKNLHQLFGPFEGSKAREVIVQDPQTLEQILKRLDQENL